MTLLSPQQGQASSAGFSIRCSTVVSLLAKDGAFRPPPFFFLQEIVSIRNVPDKSYRIEQDVVLGSQYDEWISFVSPVNSRVFAIACYLLSAIRNPFVSASLF